MMETFAKSGRTLLARTAVLIGGDGRGARWLARTAVLIGGDGRGARWLARTAVRAYQIALTGIAVIVSAACNNPDSGTVRLPDNSAARKGEDPPVMVNSQSPVEYPPTLFARGIEGKVILRLYTDESGAITAESTRVAESSGYPALDSAAIAAVPQFKFAPALRDGQAVSGSFLQPVHFRHPQAGGTTP